MKDEPDKEKRARGRPVTNEVKTIPDTAERIAKAIFRDADQRLVRPTNKSGED